MDRFCSTVALFLSEKRPGIRFWILGDFVHNAVFAVVFGFTIEAKIRGGNPPRFNRAY